MGNPWPQITANDVSWAAATLTLAMPKIGLQNHPDVGRLLLGDISVPPSVYVDMGLPERWLFNDSPIVEII